MTKTERPVHSHKLRCGFTTGACAAAAARGAAQMLASQTVVEEVFIKLPTGLSATFQLHGQTFTNENASCFVIKDAGDDPDITNGAEIHAEVTAKDREQGSGITIEGGVGVGRVTKPGLAIQPGEWAINPVPRQMIVQAVRDAFSIHQPQFSVRVMISVPDGAERAKKTLNSRLGIIGGLSILGTTGIVRPISAKAWTDTIDAALDVAKACGCKTVVLSTGRSSEMAVQEMFRLKGQGSGVKEYSGLPIPLCSLPLPEEAYVMMGDHIAYALQACVLRGFLAPVIACQFAKLLKIACGHKNTHAAASDLDLAILRDWSEAENLPHELISIINAANTAREVAIATAFDARLMNLVIARAQAAAAVHAAGIHVHPLVCRYAAPVV